MSQSATSIPGRGGRRKRPLLFAEHGALTLTTVLNSRRDAGPQDERLRASADAHIGEAIRMQKALGLRCVTDGEFRRESWRLGAVQKGEGLVLAAAVGDVDLQRDDPGNVARIGSASVAVSRVRRNTARFSEDFVFPLAAEE